MPDASERLIEEILASQSVRGAFRSTVNCGQIIEDENCFMTAMVLLELAAVREHLPASMERAIARALDFVESCEDSDIPGAFHFYSRDASASRLHYDNLRADIDDTVLAVEALVAFDRYPISTAQRTLAELIMPWSVPPGVFRTWFTMDLTDNPVDLCVNANVASLFALCGKRCPAVCELLEKSAPIVNSENLAGYCPYYAHPLELFYAVRHACDYGANELESVLRALKTVESVFQRDRPICGDASGPPFWMCASLQAARELRYEIIRFEEPSLDPHESRGVPGIKLP